MASFTPPTIADRDAVPKYQPVEMDRWQWAAAKQLFRHYGGNPRGLSVVKVAGHYQTVDGPEITILTGVEGVDYFLGGHGPYTVTTAVGNALTADGYTVI